MLKQYLRVTPLLLLLYCGGLNAQDLRFRKVMNSITGQVSGMAQDDLGIIWISTFDQGLKRYDGINLKSYIHDPGNPNSLSGNIVLALTITKDKMIWLGTGGSGIDKFDPVSNTFTNFRHDPENPASISSDTVSGFLEDHLGNFWIATNNGLDLLDRKTGKFMHYRHEKNNPSSLSHNEVYKIFEDRNGELWVGCWPFINEKAPGSGGLNRFDRKTGKFTRYLFDPAKPNGIGDNRIVQLYEDSHDNFWVATFPSGLYKMDRSTGEFARHYPDPRDSVMLSQTQVPESLTGFITFITEDANGAFWIGLGNSGMNRYDPVTKKSRHYGYISDGDRIVSRKDTITGFTSRNAFAALSTRDGLFWVCATDGALFNLNYRKTTVPFFTIGQEQANSFYWENSDNILWVGTGNGLLRRNLTTNKEEVLEHDPKNDNSLVFNRISSMRVDKEGFFWLGTRGGLDKFDPRTKKFLHYKYDPANPGGVSSNNFNYLFIDHQENLWAASDSGISRMDKRTGVFQHFKPNAKDSTGIFGYNFLCIAEDKDHFIWVSSDYGVFRLDTRTGKFKRYIPTTFIKSICVDSKGVIWAGGDQGLYYFDKATDTFNLFADEYSPVSISAIINVQEDDNGNLWVSTSSSLVKISEDRRKLKKYTESNGIRFSSFYYNDNFKGKDGRLFFGENGGYYSFFPGELSDSTIAPQLFLSGFKLRNKEVNVDPGGILKVPVWETSEIHLRHNQNVFSFDFFALDYISPGDEKYLFMLENYDDTWRDIGSERRAFFFNIPPGKYIFRIKAVGGDGGSVEKSINIIISPPWWKTWWAYSLYVLLLILSGYLVYKYQKYYIVKKERERTREKELAQAKEIEKAYTDLKTTQAQLIQSEKMASLGELTAGIAHEIQNPLNFVNNFSEVNKELLEELNDEIAKGNYSEARSIAKDVSANQDKITLHGKRADAIVKGMLQHSRTSSGKKESTDLNALCDEYLRLAYHGLRAKDKSFNAILKTDFEISIGKVNIIPQDIGRVVLNLITNAFYAVDQKKKQGITGYEPEVGVTTRKTGAGVEIVVRDNGNGIPSKILDKIFQPFFTTKPTGQGTGLGLSLSYDIVKAHGGTLSVQTKENEGSAFTLQLPVSYA